MVPRGRNYLQVIGIQATALKVEQRVMAASQKSIAAPVAAVVGRDNDVSCFYDL